MMRGLFDDDDLDRRERRRRRLKLMVPALAFVVLIGMLPGVAPGIFGGVTVIVFILLIALFGVFLMVSVRKNGRQSTAETAFGKRKRGIVGEDMYTLIDRMMDDLDEDELDYLRQRLEVREHGPKHELAESLGDLLDQREDYRESGQR